MSEKLDLDALERANLGRVVRPEDWMALLAYARDLERRAELRNMLLREQTDRLGAANLRVIELESASQPGGGEAVLAPREATEEMLNATRGKNCSPGTWNNWQKKRHATIYRQMIAALAAPSAGNGGK